MPSYKPDTSYHSVNLWSSAGLTGWVLVSYYYQYLFCALNRSASGTQKNLIDLQGVCCLILQESLCLLIGSWISENPRFCKLHHINSYLHCWQVDLREFDVTKDGPVLFALPQELGFPILQKYLFFLGSLSA